MEQDLEKEDLSSFFNWKSVIEREGFLQQNADEKSDASNCEEGKIKNATDLVKLLRGENKTPKFSAVGLTQDELKSFKLPLNREVELITKWKEVMKSEDDLQIVRGVCAKKNEEFSKRWRKIEKGQVEMKQNMVTYNNIVKDKQGKVADGMSKRMMEKQKQMKQRAKSVEVEKSLNNCQKAKEKLEATLISKEVFNEYLESVLENSGKKFGDMEHLISRCRALVETREEK
jgi:hypothetical protein